MRKLVKMFIFVVVAIVAVVLFVVTVQQHHDTSGMLVRVKNLSIKPLENSQDPVPDFTSYTVTQNKKRAFFGYLLPEIRRQNKIVEKERTSFIGAFKIVNHATR